MLTFVMAECLRVFTRFPQTTRVFFGGAHDNGYSSTLNYLQNEGLQDKLTILLGYKDLAYELKNLNLPLLEIEGVFMTKKMPNINMHKKTNSYGQSMPLPRNFTPPPTNANQQLNHDGEKARGKKNNQPQADQPTPPQQARFLTPGLVSGCCLLRRSPRTDLLPQQPLHKRS